MSKVMLLAAGAAGYVLGTRAGRERYEQIRAQSQKLWSNPRVQQAKSDAQEKARDTAPVVGDKIGGAAKKAAGSVQSKTSSPDSSDHADILDDPNIAGPKGTLP